MASFRKRFDRWQARVSRMGLPPLARSFPTKAEAEKWARAVEREIDLEQPVVAHLKPDQTSLEELIKRYLLEVVPRLRGASTERIRLNTIMERLGTLRVTSIRPSAVAYFRDVRLKQASPSTVVRELQSLSALLNHARREWGVAIKTPVSEIRKPSPNRARERRLQPGEEARLLAALAHEGRKPNGQWGTGTRNSWIAPLVRFALATAMRRGELLGLRWVDIDLQRRTAFLPITKNGSQRVVPLSSEALSVLQSLPRNSDGLVFPISPNALKHAWLRACAAAKIDDLHFHDLRHEATSRIAQKLPNLIELSSVTVLNRYRNPRHF